MFYKVRGNSANFDLLSSVLTLSICIFVPDKYFLGISAHKRGIRSIDSHENVATLDIVDSGSTMMNYGPAAKTLAVFISNAVWRIDNINDK